MSDHAWVQEHIAVYLAGGLGAQEAERLEAHLLDCPECGSALAAARQLDGGLLGLFAGAHPAPGLEDRALARLRAGSPLRGLVLDRRARWAVVAAAVLLLGAIGAVAGSLAAGGQPGAPSFSLRSPRELLRKEGEAAAEPERAERDRAMASEDRATRGEAEARAAREMAEKLRAAAGNRFEDRGVPDRVGRVIIDPSEKGALALPFDPADAKPVPPSLEPFAVKDRFPWYARNPPDGGSESKPEPKPQPANPPKGPGVDPKSPEPNPEPVRRIILRSGEMEFEIESFDAVTATVTKLVLGIKGAFVATVNSDKLTNGKMKGSITVRVPPEHLDGLVLDLRRELGRGGELKGVKLTSQDVTKMYTDLESRLRAARTMEQRLLQIIKEGKGEIKQLLEAERELGVWRTKIEETEGELRYYSNLAAFSTLTITLTEREIRAAAAVTERERVQAGVEVEDVDKAYQQVLAAVLEAKGRITKSELKQLAAGQFNATFQFEVAPESGGPIRDRLRMLGRVARLEIDRSVQTEGGTLPSDAKTKRGDTLFLVQLYNLANVAPRETATLQVAVTDVPGAYQALRDTVAKAGGRVWVAQLNEQDRQNVTAQLDFDVRRAEEGAVRTALEAAGEVMSRQVGRAAESDSVTDSKVMYRVTLVAAGRLRPRETTTLTVEVADVEGSATLFAAQVAEAKGRQVDAKFDRAGRGQETAKLIFEVPLPAAAGLVERFKGAGAVRAAQSVRDPQATEGRYATARIEVTLTNVEAIVPEGSGLWPQVRQGLSISATVLLTSVTWVVFGLCVVLPWAVIGLGGYRLVRRFVQPAHQPPAPTPPTAV